MEILSNMIRLERITIEAMVTHRAAPADPFNFMQEA